MYVQREKIVKIIFNYVNIFLYESMKIRYFFCYHYHEGIRLFSRRTEFEKKRKKERSVSSLKIDSSVWTEQRAEKLKFRYIHSRQLYLSITVDCIFIVSDSLHILLFHTSYLLLWQDLCIGRVNCHFPIWMDEVKTQLSKYVYVLCSSTERISRSSSRKQM